MKLTAALFATLLVTGVVFAQDITLRDYNYTVTDVARRGLTKERLFQGMDRTFLKIGDSICSNRALVWAYNFERQYRIDTAKLFLFYTDKTGEAGDKTWWYHVTPLVNENGQLWALDAGFPGSVRRPLTIREWLTRFAGSTNCKELTLETDDLTELIFNKRRFPSTTRHGSYDCYYRVTSAPFWTPNTVAQNMLGRNRDGRPGTYLRDEIKEGELLQACKEASTTQLGGLFVNKEKRCREYLGLP